MNKKNVCAGIDIGGTNSEIGLIDRDGNLLFTATLSTRAYPQAELFAKDAVAVIRKGLEESGTVLSGIGIGAPSANYYNGSIEHAPNMPWKGIVPLASMIEKESGVNSLITNDANAAALGEQFFGAAKFMQNFIVVTLGTGLGSGIVVNDQVLYGHDGFAGELGHVIIEPNGRLCGCSRRGCLETYVSATGIVNTAKELIAAEKPQTILNEIPLDELQSHQIAAAAKNGDAFALRLMDYTAEKLGFALANVIAITSPSHIFLYGGLAKAGELILAPARRYMEQYLLRNFKGKVSLEMSALPDHAAVLGAAALAWKQAID